MISLIALFWVHFFADFILQTDSIALNKSEFVSILIFHVSLYVLPFAFIWGWKYAAVNWIGHFMTDYFSSKLTPYLWKKEKRHWFFVIIGLDQVIHLTTLLITLPLFAPIALVPKFLNQ